MDVVEMVKGKFEGYNPSELVDIVKEAVRSKIVGNPTHYGI